MHDPGAEVISELSKANQKLRNVPALDAFGVYSYLAAAGLAVLYCLHRAHVYVPGMPVFWDARVYLRALQDWQRGTDPYITAAPFSHGTTLPFVSPPVFLWVMVLLSHLIPAKAGAFLYLVLSSLSALALPAVIARFYLRTAWMPAALCLLITWFQPEKHGSQALLSGNLSNVLYAAVLCTGALALSKGRWLPFYIAVVFAGLMKPPFVAFLLFPLLTGRSQWRSALGAFVAVFAGCLFQRATTPMLWQEFQHNVYDRVFLQGDAGFGLLGQMQLLSHHLPWLLHLGPTASVAIILAPLFGCLILLRRRRFLHSVEEVWLPCLLVSAILCNPRTLDYDADIAVLPALYIALQFFHRLRDVRWRNLLTGSLLIAFVALLESAPDIALCALLLGSVMLVIVQLAWPALFRVSTGR